MKGSGLDQTRLGDAAASRVSTDGNRSASPEQLNLFPTSRRGSQLSQLPGTEWEHIFVCLIDESAGLSEDTT